MKLKSLSDLQQFLPQSDMTGSMDSRHNGKGKPVRVFLDTKGRKGKSVTIVAGLVHNPDTMKEISRILKEYCATGGTVKDGNIELQGDQRSKASAKLSGMNYKVSA